MVEVKQNKEPKQVKAYKRLRAILEPDMYIACINVTGATMFFDVGYAYPAGNIFIDYADGNVITLEGDPERLMPIASKLEKFGFTVSVEY